jgi:PAT family beta-lactamase induction signal transducer AmpG
MAAGAWRRIWVQAPLAFSAGLPLLLCGETLRTWLTTEDISVDTIAAFTLVALPYNFKWLWAPLLDRYPLPFLDRRRGWMLVVQFLLGATIAVLGTVDAPHNLATLAVLAVAVAFLSATQDILIDAYRADVVAPGERGRAGAVYIGGYRVANLAAGPGALLLATVIEWRTVYWIMAALMAVGVFATLIAPSPPSTAPPRDLRSAVVQPFSEFLRRRGAIVAVLFILLYKIGDSVAGDMMNTFLIRGPGFDLGDIAVYRKFVGLGATIAGATVGGILADRMDVRRSLLLFGMAQALGNIGYVFLALSGKSYAGLVAAIAIDNVCNGLGAAVFVAYLMSLCNQRFSATQYALFTSLVTAVGRMMTATSGGIIGSLGWAGFFGLTIVAAVPALVLIRWLPEGVQPAAPPQRRAYRLLAAAIAAGLGVLIGWNFAFGDWKLAIGLIVPSLCFGAYALVTGPRGADDDDEHAA